MGGNTAADSWGKGVSKAGGMRVKGSCFTPNAAKASTVSGIILVSNPNRESLKSFVKFFGRLSDSCGTGGMGGRRDEGGGQEVREQSLRKFFK